MDLHDGYDALFSEAEERITACGINDEQREWAIERLKRVRNEIKEHTCLEDLMRCPSMAEELVYQRFFNLEEPYDYFGLGPGAQEYWTPDLVAEQKEKALSLETELKPDWDIENTAWGW